MRLGAIWVGVNRVLAPPEKVYLLRDAGATVVEGFGDLPQATLDALARLRQTRETASP